MDVHPKDIRSYNMSRIKSTRTAPEMIVRRFMHKNGLRYRVNKKNMPGCPDIVLKKYNAVVFVNGCFWHLHDNCRYVKIPKTNTEWWLEKLKQNKIRDEANIVKLREMGWRVFIIWECQLKGENYKLLSDIVDKIKEK